MYFRLGIFIGWFCFLAIECYAAPKTTLGLADAKDFAIRNNYKIQALREKIAERQHSHDAYKSAYYPKLGVKTGISSEFAGGVEDSGAVGYLYSSYNIFNGGRDAKNIQKYKVEVDIAQVELENAEFEIGLLVEEYFYNYIFISKLIDLKSEALKVNNANKKYVQKKRNAGIVTEADEMEFSVRDSLLQSEFVSRKFELEEARIQLKKILGQEIGASLIPMGELQQSKMQKPLMHYVDSMKKKNFSIKKSALEVQRAEIEYGLASRSWLPSIDFEAQYGLLPIDERMEGFDDEATAKFLLVADFNLFRGKRDSSERKATERAKVSADNEMKNNIVLAISDVEVFYRKLKAIETRIDLEKNNIQRTKKYYDAVVKEYRLGSKNSSDLGMAADQYFQALESRERQKFDFIKNRIQFERFLGEKVEEKVSI